MKSMFKTILSTMLLVLAGQSAFALDGRVCAEGTIYLNAPASWTEAYAFAGGTFVPFEKQADGWWTVSSSQVGMGPDDSFIITSAKNDFCQKPGITSLEWDQGQCSYQATIPCSKTGDLYVFENPTNPGKTVYSENPPNAKYFFVMIPPDYEEWMSAVPMISIDGGQTGKPMTAVDDMCGWYSYVFVGENQMSDNVVLFRDDDPLDPTTNLRADMIGVNGNWEQEDHAQPIPLEMIFNMGIDTLFFVPDEEQKTNEDGYYYSAAEVNGIEGTCSYTMAAVIYDTDASLHPAFSCYKDGGGEGCQNGIAKWGITAQAAQAFVDYCIGVHTGLVESHLDPTVPQSQRKPKSPQTSSVSPRFSLSIPRARKRSHSPCRSPVT